jgi:hypothetical protein
MRDKVTLIVRGAGLSRRMSDPNHLCCSDTAYLGLSERRRIERDACTASRAVGFVPPACQALKAALASVHGHANLRPRR